MRQGEVLLLPNRLLLISCLFYVLTSCGSGENGNQNTQITDKLFISLPIKDSLTVIDPSQEKELARIKVGKLPHNLRLTEDRKTLYVTLVGSQAIAEVDVESQTLRRTFLTAPLPLKDSNGQEISDHQTQSAIDSHTCFDCHNGGQDSAKPVIIGTRPFGLALTNGNQIIVANSRSASISYIDIESGKIVKSFDVDAYGDAHEPTEVALMDDVLFVTVRPVLPSSAPSVLRAYDLNSFSLLAEAEVGSAVSDLKIDKLNRHIFISNFESNTVEEFDENLQLIKTSIVGNGPFGIRLQPNSQTIANYYNNSISRISQNAEKIETSSLELDGKSFSNPTHITYSTDNRNLFVISGGTNGYLLTVNKENLKVNTAREIDGLAFDIINTNINLEEK